MTKLAARPGFTAGSVGVILLSSLALTRFVATANANHVFVGERMVHWGCWFQQRFGIPCPTCGMTRSVLLTLHGQFNEAVRLNPAGLMLVVGVVLLGLALLFLMFYQQRSTRLAAGAVHRYIRIGTSVYGGLLVVALFAHWLGEIALR